MFADRGKRGAEIDRGRGLADAAFLIGDGERSLCARRRELQDAIDGRGRIQRR
jgi:hypothetical protein